MSIITQGKIPMDFAAELKKLLDAEDNPPTDPLAELTLTQARLLEGIYKDGSDISRLLEGIYKTGSDISLQVEEVYDIVKEADENAKEVRSAAKRESQLLGGLIAISDLLDDILDSFQYGNSVHSGVIAAKRDEILDACGLEKYESLGRQLDPRLHTVVSAECSDAPVESVTRVLESGYMYRGNVIRRATVIISKGKQA